MIRLEGYSSPFQVRFCSILSYDGGVLLEGEVVLGESHELQHEEPGQAGDAVPPAHVGLLADAVGERVAIELAPEHLLEWQTLVVKRRWWLWFKYHLYRKALH